MPSDKCEQKWRVRLFDNGEDLFGKHLIVERAKTLKRHFVFSSARVWGAPVDLNQSVRFALDSGYSSAH